jgi:CHASE1-domain containing sensor protein
MENEKAKSVFHSAAEDRFDELQSDLQLSVVRVTSLGAFCNSAYPVTRTSFDTFTVPLISGSDAAIQALEWVPRVSQNERAEVERSARAAGFPEFEIRDRLQQGMVRSGDRAEYFPVLWVQPYKGNEPALGFDMASNLIRREALMRAEAIGQPTASKRITLVQETGKQYGILILQPVYRSASGSSRQLLGFALGVLRISSIVEKHGAHSGIDLTLTDMAADAADQQLYPSDGRSPQPASDFTRRSTITVGGRTWMLTASPSPGAFPVGRNYSYLGFLLSLSLTLLVVAYLWNSLFRHMQVERLVEQRTAALNSAMTLLEEVGPGIAGWSNVHPTPSWLSALERSC